MSKRLYKIIEIIGVLIIFLIIYRLFPFVNIILKYIFKIIMPFLIAFSIAFIFEPFIVFLEKKKIIENCNKFYCWFIYIDTIFIN